MNDFTKSKNGVSSWTVNLLSSIKEKTNPKTDVGSVVKGSLITRDVTGPNTGGQRRKQYNVERTSSWVTFSSVIRRWTVSRSTIKIHFCGSKKKKKWKRCTVVSTTINLESECFFRDLRLHRYQYLKIIWQFSTLPRMLVSHPWAGSGSGSSDPINVV